MASPVLKTVFCLLTLLGASRLSTVAGDSVQDGWDSVQEKGSTDPPNDGRKNVQSMTVEAPIMTEEDQHGYNMPKQYLCDACKAVVFHLNETLVKRQPKNRRLKEWEYVELFDEICANSFEGYGLKFMNGENVLSGPALKERDEQFLKPGGAMIQMGGENWKKRMGETCRKTVYDKIGEEELYGKFREDGELRESMCFSVTRDCSLGPKAPAQAEEKKKSKSGGAEKKRKQQGSEKKEKPAAASEKKKEEQKKKANMEGTMMKAGKKAAAPGKDEKKSGGRSIDVTYFLAQLAVEHGVAPKEYTKNRSREEWERMVVQLAGKIFAKKSDTLGGETEEKEAPEPVLEV